MEKKEVFISYKTEEFDEANWVRSTLEHNGISCWMAPMCIPGGSSYAVEIPQAIKNCRVFVLILSERSQLSKWVPRELDQAINEGKLIMPFMLENCALKDDFNFYLTNVQRYNAYESKAVTIEKMIREIRGVLGKNEPVKEDKTAPEQPKASVEKQPEPVKAEPEIPAAPKPPAAPQKPHEAVKAKQESGRQNTQKPAKKKGKTLPIVLGAIAAWIVVLVLIFSIASTANKVEIAGQDFHKDDRSFCLSDASLSAEDIQAFSKFKDLWYIELSNCSVSCDDISVFSQFDLYTLELSNCQLSKEQIATLDFSAMDSLYGLDLSGNPGMEDLTVLSGIEDTLKKLDISNTSVQDITGIEGFANLSSLAVNNNGITSLKPLSACIYLEELQAGGNQLTSLEGLENTTLLWSVYLCDNSIEDISVLSRSAATLQKVYLRNNKISDLSALKDCANLTYLTVDNNQLTTLLPLENCNALCSVLAADNMITSVEGLLGCEQLAYLDLSGNGLTTLDAPEMLTFEADGYIHADFSDNALTGAALPLDCYYSYLALYGNEIGDLTSLQTVKGNRLIMDYADTIDYTALSETSFNNYEIVGCPLGEKVNLETVLGKAYVVFLDSAEGITFLTENMPESVLGISGYGY